ncbi:histidine kinase OS=Streptomyces tendae OX=1932 GN=GUR47_13705 PE=4 SV=1 [Streptomyces tendae]
MTILGNLVDNAVDAAQGAVPSRVTVAAYTQDAGRPGPELVLRVSDTGAGVDPAHADLVFQRGYSTKQAGEGGRGLGLALVRQAVRRHGGTLAVTEAEGGGAGFEARLPLGDAGGGGATPAASVGQTGRRGAV